MSRIIWSAIASTTLALVAACGGGSAPSTAPTLAPTAAPTPAPTPQVLHLRGYDISPEGYREWLSELIDITRPEGARVPTFCTSTAAEMMKANHGVTWHNLTVSAVENVEVSNPMESLQLGYFVPPASAVVKPAQVVDPLDAITQATTLLDICQSVMTSLGLP